MITVNGIEVSAEKFIQLSLDSSIELVQFAPSQYRTVKVVEIKHPETIIEEPLKGMKTRKKKEE